MIKIGNAAGFWGDDIDAAKRLLMQQPDLDYLTLDYLAEVSLSIMAIQREKEPTLGYARDFVYVIQSLIPTWKKGAHCKVITNAGGLNPRGLAKLCAQEISKAGLDLKIAVIEGDNVIEQLRNDPKNVLYNHLDSQKPLSDVLPNLITANAYLGARPIADALEKGADIVIGGRIADPSLTVGPCLYHFGWKETDYQKIAGATVAGHLIECGTQATGGISTDWQSLPHLDEIGFPVAEINEEGHCVLTKPSGTGGRVDEPNVKEQLLYELGDPAHYKSPDATVSFLELSVKQVGPDRVLIKGAKGAAPPKTYKVSATYRAGFKTETYLAFFGENVIANALKAGEIIFKKVKRAGYSIEYTCLETLGSGGVVPGIKSQAMPFECALHIAARDHNKASLEYLSKQIAPLVTAGPQGTTGYISGRPEVRPVFGFWPCLIPRVLLAPRVELLQI